MKFLKLKIFLILLFSFRAAVAYSQDGVRITLGLDQAIDLALENNENVLIANNDVKTANAQIREAWADALPEIDFNGLYTRNFREQIIFFPDIFGGDPTRQVPIPISSKNSYSFTLSVNQPLFQAGKVTKGIKAANLFKEFSSEGYEAVRSDVVLSVKKAYYTVQLNEQLLDINRQSLDQQFAHLVNTRKLFGQGQVSELDTLRAWVDYTNIKPRVILMENNLRISENLLKEVVGLELKKDIRLKDDLIFEQTEGLSLEAIQENALNNRHELRQLEYQKEILKQNIGITRADHLPKLYLSGTYQGVAQSNSFDFGSGLEYSVAGSVRLEVPIFKGFRTSAKVQQAKLDYENARYQVKMFTDNLKIEVKSIYLNIKQAEKRVQVQQHAIKQAERALFMAQRRYNEGVGTQLESSDALLALNIAKSNYIQAVYDHKIALAELHKAIGRR